MIRGRKPVSSALITCYREGAVRFLSDSVISELLRPATTSQQLCTLDQTSNKELCRCRHTLI